jgi:DNA-binding MarR family transcriptional regulator
MTAPVAAAVERAELLTELEREVGVMVRRLRRVLGERARAVHPDLQTSTYLLLSWVDRHGPVRASAVAESLGIDKGAISRQVQHLLELGLLDRTPDPDDGRATLLSANDEAKGRLREVSQASRLWLDGKLGDLPDAELADFVRLLGRYNAALDA